MSDVFRCENCRFSVQQKLPKEQVLEFGNLVCRRFPPVGLPVDEGRVVGALASVNHNWWCGEWAAIVLIKEVASWHCYTEEKYSRKRCLSQCVYCVGGNW